eukprot:GHUV01023210.1.p1 GENE.GHUV01023210.1~~GHUV01023210.1.p1  ORF type:complete len:135 (+),score=10.62 GHUV01023210.1:16-420(+)
MGWVHNLNKAVANSKVGRYFQIRERESTTEVRAGIVTFLTVCYILAVNLGILADTGATGSDADCTVSGLLVVALLAPLSVPDELDTRLLILSGPLVVATVCKLRTVTALVDLHAFMWSLRPSRSIHLQCAPTDL